ncbi:MAG: MotA/TolQ/ExbB proton channel family protein [Firmicutes bacterium]|nr:MotA/TolQ/ExbB proton channel family protein [Bacillota bacterium]
MDKGTLIGLALGAFSLIFSILLAIEFDMVMFGAMIDIPSIVMVVGGAFASSLIGAPFEHFTAAMKAHKIVLKPPKSDPAEAIGTIVGLANTARKEGVLALEDTVSNMDDEFLKKGIMLIVDGTDPELVKGIMETELAYIEERHNDVADVFAKIAKFAPAWGMMGTLIGLIIMLQNLDDMAAIGPAMGMALLTTFYGCVVANFYGDPFSGKLGLVSKEEVLLKTVLIEGMLSIQAGENPRIIEEKLKSFLAPMMRDRVGEGAGGGAAE